MVEAGVLGEDDAVQLLDGEIVVMAPIGPGHAAIVNRLARLLQDAVDGRFVVSVQNPVRLSRSSEPQPDLALLVRRDDDYEDALPLPGEVALVVEVADSSVELDRRVKLPLYAQAGIGEVWLVDLAAGSIEVNREPRDRRHAKRTVYGRGATLCCAAVPELVIAVDDALPRLRSER